VDIKVNRFITYLKRRYKSYKDEKQILDVVKCGELVKEFNIKSNSKPPLDSLNANKRINNLLESNLTLMFFHEDILVNFESDYPYQPFISVVFLNSGRKIFFDNKCKTYYKLFKNLLDKSKDPIINKWLNRTQREIQDQKLSS
jgi:hypothetical protein